MGVDLHVLEFLLEFRDANLGACLCLGRQGLHIRPGTPQWDVANSLIKSRDSNADMEQMRRPDGYSEGLLEYLGCRTVRSLDYSAFEGAEIIYDLNKPVPAGLHDRFDVIFDGGTLEHVFDIPCAITSVKKMLRPNGLFLTVNAANNQLGHGFYQFSPELFWRVFGDDPNYEIEQMRLVAVNGTSNSVILGHPGERREELGGTNTPAYVMCAARKTATPLPYDGMAYQGDYAARWRSR